MKLGRRQTEKIERESVQQLERGREMQTLAQIVALETDYIRREASSGVLPLKKCRYCAQNQ